MFCEKCGQSVPDHQAFCPNCGAAQNVNVTVAPKSAVGDTYKKIMYGLIALTALATLLPFYTVSFWGMSESINFLFVNGEFADGIFIVIAAVVAFFLVYKGKDKFVAIPMGIGIIILLLTTSNASDTLGSIGSFSIGYYLIWFGLIASTVLPFTPISKK